MKSLRTLLVALSAILLTTLAAYAGDPTGTWKFGEGREGSKSRDLETTLVLQLQDSQLTGTIDNRAGKAKITDAQFADDKMSFTIVREIGRRFRKQTLTVRYAGTLEGDTIRGTIETTGRDRKPVSLPWVAHRAK